MGAPSVRHCLHRLDSSAGCESNRIHFAFFGGLCIRYIEPNLLRIKNMDYSLITQRLGEQLRQRRLHRGLTQAALASLAGITRQKVIAIERGDFRVGMIAYARVLAALDAELDVVPAAMPTLDEIHGVFD